MKTIFTFLIAVIFSLNLTAQDTGFVHTVTADNIPSTAPYATLIDHPLLNGNPEAKVLFVQRGGGAENINPTGIAYGEGRWGIYNENEAAIPIGASFNIYVADHSEVATHVADASNTTDFVTYLDGYGAIDYLFANTYYNPHGVYNPLIYGTLYSISTVQRALFNEGVLLNIPNNAGFRTMSGSPSSATFASIASNADNTNGNSLMLDHPALNGNPDAVFLYSHYYGIAGNETHLNYITRASYNSSLNQWYIYAFGASGFPEGVWIDIIIPDVVLGVEDVKPELSKITLYPNPVRDIVNIASSKTPVQEIQIYDVSGKLVQSSRQNGKTVTLNLSGLPSGLYLAKVLTEEGWFSQKLIKK